MQSSGFVKTQADISKASDVARGVGDMSSVTVMIDSAGTCAQVVQCGTRSAECPLTNVMW